MFFLNILSDIQLSVGHFRIFSGGQMMRFRFPEHPPPDLYLPMAIHGAPGQSPNDDVREQAVWALPAVLSGAQMG